MPTLELAIDARNARSGAMEWERQGRLIDTSARRTAVAADKLGSALRRVFAGVSTALAVRETFALQTALAEVSTLVDTSAVNMGGLRREILDLAAAQDTAATSLAGGLYQTISAGITDAGQAMAVLATSNKLAVAGLAETKQVVDVVTTALTAYQLSADQAGRVSDVLFTTVQRGKTTLPELASALGKVLPLAATMGFTFEDVAAAVATLTAGGLATSEAVTGLRAVFQALIKPSSEAAEILSGIDLSKARIQADGLAGVLTDLQARLGGSEQAMTQVFGSVEALVPVFSLAGAQADSFADNLAGMQTAAGATEIAFEKMRGTAAASFSALLASARQLAIVGFEPITKAAQGIISSLTDALKVLGGFEDAVKGNRAQAEAWANAIRTTGAGITAFIGIVTAARIATAAFNATLLLNPITLVVVALAAVVAALVTYRNELVTVEGVTASVIDFVVGAWEELVARLRAIYQAASALWITYTSGLTPVLESVTRSIADVWGALMALLNSDTASIARDLGAIFLELGRLVIATVEASIKALDRLLKPLQAVALAIKAQASGNLADSIKATVAILEVAQNGLKPLDPREFIIDMSDSMARLQGLGATVEREAEAARKAAIAGMTALAAAFGVGADNARSAFERALAGAGKVDLAGVFDFGDSVSSAAQRAGERAAERFQRAWESVLPRVAEVAKAAALIMAGFVPLAPAAPVAPALPSFDVPAAPEVSLGASDLAQAEAALAAYLDDLRFERELVGLGNVERERAIILRQAEAAAAGLQSEAITGYLRQIEDEAKRLTEAVDLQRFFDDLGRGFADPIGEAILGLQSLEETINAIALNISRTIVQRNLVDPLAEAASGAFSGLLGGAQAPGGAEDGAAAGAALTAATATAGATLTTAGTATGAAIIAAATQAAAILASAAGASAAAGVVSSARGNAFDRGRVVPFAIGGVVDRPTLFPMAGGDTGLAGEAGPEAILPLRRGAGGRLGVEVSGAGGGNVTQVTNTYNVSTPDANSFRRSKRQLASDANRGLRRF